MNTASRAGSGLRLRPPRDRGEQVPLVQHGVPRVQPPRPVNHGACRTPAGPGYRSRSGRARRSPASATRCAGRRGDPARDRIAPAGGASRAGHLRGFAASPGSSRPRSARRCASCAPRSARLRARRGKRGGRSGNVRFSAPMSGVVNTTSPIRRRRMRRIFVGVTDIWRLTVRSSLRRSASPGCRP